VLKATGLQLPANVHAVTPFTYLELIGALANAAFALTDSGGLQKEAYWLRVPCVTLRDTTEWTETVSSGWNQIAGASRHSIIDAVSRVHRPDVQTDAYGVNGASARVVQAVELLH
jgi:UDP-N-acetylglucosamine 2-epimerase